jgi:ribosomal protein S18 acetylase RimI-like enzyme
MKLAIHPLTAGRWPDLEALFAAKGCSVARGCWCMCYRETGQQDVPEDATLRQLRKERLRELAAGDPPPGLIGYLGGKPVGWVSLGPRADFIRFERSPVLKPVDDSKVWSIICFVVPSEHRGQGVATALLDGAIRYARKRGVRILEAYPMDKAKRAHDEDMWFGALSMFSRAGFEEVLRRKPERPIVRLSLRS